ncbi:ParB/RepB/Spo0J family partition protein [Salinisphaera aquimarina]|uniref:Probable chromosome-partitioning protein ParB n=1 Tax=Salinisphaera aquimarina TaxID=2094031 RepID=A0ABV7EMV9_9GAMM
MTDRSTTAQPGATTVVTVPIELIRAGTSQARTAFDSAALAELAASIRESGVIQPVVVSGAADTGYRLLAGERRWRAAQQVGLDELPAIIRNDLSAEEAAVLGLIENLQRESLGVMDTARGLGQLCDAHGLTHDAVARRIGKSRVYVTNYLRVRQLAEPVQRLLEDGALQLGHAKILAGLDTRHQIALARRAAQRHMTVRALEQAARRIDEDNIPSDSATNEGLAELETRLADHVGNAVKIHYDADRRHGELRISFHDLDEFDGLLARLGYVGE